MFPLQRSNELVPHPIISAPMPCQEDQIQEDLISAHASIKTTDNEIKRRQRRLSHVQVNSDDNNMDYKHKKVMHRDIERQRRQEMANLNTSLRSLLPLEYIKGKRSISDHMDEAVNYIKNLQKNIKELDIRRNKLKNLPDSGVENRRLDHGSLNCVTISPCQDGMEILISSGLKEETFPLSRVLWKLLEEGISVVTCSSTREKGRSLHIIQSEVSDKTYIDLPKLQQKIADVINHNFNSE